MILNFIQSIMLHSRLRRKSLGRCYVDCNPPYDSDDKTSDSEVDSDDKTSDSQAYSDNKTLYLEVDSDKTSYLEGNSDIAAGNNDIGGVEQ